MTSLSPLSTMLAQQNSAAQTSYGYDGSAAIAAKAQAIIDAAAKAGSNATASASSDVSISNAAKIAAAEQADNAKDFATLSNQVRATLDAQYAAAKAAGESAMPDLSEMSGRALAAIALNKTGAFSQSEMGAARSELRDRALTELQTALKSGSDAMTALVNYNQQLMTDYDGMSEEERSAMGWTARTRASAERFVNTIKGSDAAPSLFEMLNSPSLS